MYHELNFSLFYFTIHHKSDESIVGIQILPVDIKLSRFLSKACGRENRKVSSNQPIKYFSEVENNKEDIRFKNYKVSDNFVDQKECSGILSIYKHDVMHCVIN